VRPANYQPKAKVIRGHLGLSEEHGAALLAGPTTTPRGTRLLVKKTTEQAEEIGVAAAEAHTNLTPISVPAPNCLGVYCAISGTGKISTSSESGSDNALPVPSWRPRTNHRTSTESICSCVSGSDARLVTSTANLLSANS
jgi:hypothetical protein